MTMPYVETLRFRQQELPDKFYFKNQKQKNNMKHQQLLQEFSRARLKIAIVTETWPPEINGVAMSLMQLCKGLQKQGHKILLIRPKQKHQCVEFSPNKECLVTAQAVPKYPDMRFGWPHEEGVTGFGRFFT